MTKNEMPAAEANEPMGYELAFHVLPTVAEGEVPAVFDTIKTALTKAGATLTDEEAPARFDLAYEIVKYLEGRNRKFSSAYFGWVRFTAQPDQVDAINEAVEGINELLRHLLIKLTSTEEAYPFRFHEALDVKHVDTIEEDDEEDTAVKAEAPTKKDKKTTKASDEDDNGEETK